MSKSIKIAVVGPTGRSPFDILNAVEYDKMKFAVKMKIGAVRKKWPDLHLDLYVNGFPWAEHILVDIVGEIDNCTLNVKTSTHIDTLTSQQKSITMYLFRRDRQGDMLNEIHKIFHRITKIPSVKDLFERGQSGRISSTPNEWFATTFLIKNMDAIIFIESAEPRIKEIEKEFNGVKFMITKKQLKNITMMSAKEEWDILSWFLANGVPDSGAEFLEKRSTGEFNGDIIVAIKEMMDATESENVRDG